MHPMDMNWYFDHDDLDALQAHAECSVTGYGHATRWVSINEDMLKRALSSMDYRVSYFNIRLDDDLGTPIPETHVIMSNPDFASINCNDRVESHELHYHCSPQNLNWMSLIDDKISVFLNCTVWVSVDGDIKRDYTVDLVLTLDAIEEMGEETFQKFMNSFL